MAVVHRGLTVFFAMLVLHGCSHAPAAPARSSFAESGLPDPLAAGWGGQPVCEKLEENSSLRVLKCSFPPGVGHERHYHEPNWGYALSGGRVRITDDSGVRELDLPTGSSFWSDGTPWHEILNIGETPIIYLIIEPRTGSGR